MVKRPPLPADTPLLDCDWCREPVPLEDEDFLGDACFHKKWDCAASWLQMVGLFEDAKRWDYEEDQ